MTDDWLSSGDKGLNQRQICYQKFTALRFKGVVYPNQPIGPDEQLAEVQTLLKNSEESPKKGMGGPPTNRRLAWIENLNTFCL